MKDFLRERQDPLFTSGDQLLHELELLTKRRVGIQFDTDQYPEFSTLLFILKVLHWVGIFLLWKNHSIDVLERRIRTYDSNEYGRLFQPYLHS